MGKKTQKKQQHQPMKETTKKISPLKRNELNHLIDKLLQLGFNPASTVTDQWNQYVQIQSILNRVRDIESDLKSKSTTNKNRQTSIEAFTKWAIDNGAQFDCIKINEFPGYELGLQAKRDIKQYEIFATVPKTMILSLDNVSHAIQPMMSQLPMIESMQNVKLAFSLIVERLNTESFWKPYIDILPEKYSTVMNFTLNEMQELKGSSALSAALNQCKNIARQYAFINKFTQSVKEEPFDPLLDVLKNKFTYELYCWAISTVMTRQNAIPRPVVSTIDTATNISTTTKTVPETQPMPALIPLWDLANHIDGHITSSYNMEQSHIEGAALKDYKEGDQVFIYYGERNNANFLVHNGFVCRENSCDSISIRLGLSTSDPLFKLRATLLDSLSIAPTSELDVLPAPIYISSKLLGFVRVFNMNEDHLNHWITSERSTDLLYLDCALETLLETKTWTFLKMRLTLLLKAFPTTLTDDQLLLDAHRKGQHKLGHIKHMLVQFRIIEKQILTDALKYVDERTKV